MCINQLDSVQTETLPPVHKITENPVTVARFCFLTSLTDSHSTFNSKVHKQAGKSAFTPTVSLTVSSRGHFARLEVNTCLHQHLNEKGFSQEKEMQITPDNSII